MPIKQYTLHNYHELLHTLHLNIHMYHKNVSNNV